MLTLRFFYFSGAQQANLARGTRLRCFGEVRRGPLGLEMVHPEYRRLGPEAAPLEETSRPSTRSPKACRRDAARAGRRGAAGARAHGAAGLDPARRPGLPEGLPSLAQRGDATCIARRARRSSQELAAGRHPGAAPPGLRGTAGASPVAQGAQARRSRPTPPGRCTDAAGLARRFLAGLPFTLTGAQRRALQDAERDLVTGVPMVRLVQGDVGCGKTVVAAAAAARAAGTASRPRSWRRRSSWPSSTGETCATGSSRSGETVALVSGSQPARARRSALAAHRRRRGAHRRRHARAVPGGHRVRAPGAGHRRRAAPLRRAAAPEAAGEGPAGRAACRTSSS